MILFCIVLACSQVDSVSANPSTRQVITYLNGVPATYPFDIFRYELDLKKVHADGDQIFHNGME